jgi:hypothetical protein
VVFEVTPKFFPFAFLPSPPPPPTYSPHPEATLCAVDAACEPIFLTTVFKVSISCFRGSTFASSPLGPIGPCGPSSPLGPIGPSGPCRP